MANHLSQLSVISIRQPNAPAKLAQWAENGRWDQAAGELGWDWGLEVAISELWKYPKVTENHVSRNVIKIRCRMANRTIGRPQSLHPAMYANSSGAGSTGYIYIYNWNQKIWPGGFWSSCPRLCFHGRLVENWPLRTGNHQLGCVFALCSAFNVAPVAGFKLVYYMVSYICHKA